MPARTPLVPNRKALGLKSEIPDRTCEKGIDGYEVVVVKGISLQKMRREMLQTLPPTECRERTRSGEEVPGERRERLGKTFARSS
jgi:hypothetical protein